MGVTPSGPAFRVYIFDHGVDGRMCYLVADDAVVYDEGSAQDQMRKVWWEGSTLTEELMRVTRTVDHINDQIDWLTQLETELVLALSRPDQIAHRQELSVQIQDARRKLSRDLMAAVAGKRPSYMKLLREE